MNELEITAHLSQCHPCLEGLEDFLENYEDALL